MTCRSALAPTYNLRTKESQARDLRQGQRFHPSYFDATTKKGAAASVEPVRPYVVGASKVEVIS